MGEVVGLPSVINKHRIYQPTGTKRSENRVDNIVC